MAYPPSPLPTDATDGTSPTDTTPTAVLTAAELNGIASAVNDIVTELGPNPSGVSATVGARLDGIEADVTALGSASIPDGSVSTAKLADGAVTAAKVAADVATQAELDAETAARTAAIAGLSGTYARLLSGQCKVGGIGDSITAGDSSGQTASYAVRQVTIGDAPLPHALYASDGRWDLVINAGVGGQTSAQILARVDADIIATGCQVCVVVSGHWNDIGQNVPVATAIANNVAIIEKCRNAGILPVVCGLTPDQRTGSTTARILAAQQIRDGVRSYCEANRVTYVDMVTPLVDTYAGTLSTAYNRDGSVHPNAAGYKAMGQQIAAVLNQIIPPRDGGLIKYAADPSDLLAGAGLFLNDTNADGVADGWTFTPATSGSTATVTTDGAVLGKMQRITGASLSGNALIDSALITVGSGISVGDWLELSFLLTGSGGTAKPRVRFVVGGSPSPNNYSSAEPAAAVTRGFVRLRWQVSAGATNVKVRLQLQAGDGYFEVGQLSVRNRTALGLATP